MPKDIDYKRALHDELKNTFIKYQFNLDNPFPREITPSSLIIKYQSDVYFKAKVDSLVYGVMDIVSRHVDKE